MRKTKHLIILSLLVLASCKGGSENSSANSNSPVISPANQVTMAMVQKQETQKINDELNSNDQYKLTSEELNDLKNEGVLSDEELEELKGMSKNN